MPRQLFMRLARLDNLPPLTEPPAGYTMRELRPGEEPLLARTLTAAFEDEWTEGRVREALVDAPDVAAVYVVADSRGPVATASARLAPEYPGAGYLHWVGADPIHRGRGLGRLVTLRVLHHFRQAGCQCSVLETDDFRIPAIRTYLALGYEPECTDDTHAERWKAVMAKVNGEG